VALKKQKIQRKKDDRTKGNACEAAGPFPRPIAHSSIMGFQGKAILGKPCDHDEEFGGGELASPNE
jgi:hypothetical protein